MSRARQNLRKRMTDVAERGSYDGRRASFGPEWERLSERRGLSPCRRATDEDVVRKLVASSLYGKLSSGGVVVVEGADETTIFVRTFKDLVDHWGSSSPVIDRNTTVEIIDEESEGDTR